MNVSEIEHGWTIAADDNLIELSNGDILAPTIEEASRIVPSLTPKPKFSFPKDAIRRSLKASTLDGIYSTVFSNITGGVLLSNFLIELKASPTEIGMLSSVPMLVNLLQPLGAHLSELTSSRLQFNLWVYGTSRLVWLVLALGIALANWHYIDAHQLILWTLSVVLMSHLLGALGCASWLSWMAILVPRRLRGRYFGLRNSAVSLANLIGIPLAGWAIAVWKGGSLQGYGIVLMLGIICGMISLGYQTMMADVDPQQQKLYSNPVGPDVELSPEDSIVPTRQKSLIADDSILRDCKFLTFLLYSSAWMFAVNLSAPFYNLYTLAQLSIDVRYVTLHGSLHAGAYLLLMMGWGRLADRIGNRPILMAIGVVNAMTPLLWLAVGGDVLSVWLWLPLIHILLGGTWAALDLCMNNLQLGIAPIARQSQYFALVAAVGGVCGALGTTAGGFLVELLGSGGFFYLFALSSVLRLAALIPLIFVREG